MSSFPLFNESNLEGLAKILGEEVNGSTLTNLFRARDIEDASGHSTKWRRIYHSLHSRQRQDRCGNNVAAFIKAVMTPGRFIGAEDRFEKARSELNAILVFDGLELDKWGNFRTVTPAKTIGEAERRAQVLTARLHGRTIHPEVMRFCKAELLQDNYFHAVFEATKSLAQRIRDLTGLKSDGASLVDEAFSTKNPLLAINTLQSETEQSEHKGFAMLIKGCFGAVRNPLAHEPKIMWTGEEDAADYLTLVSLLHRKLDEAVVVPSSKGAE
jgi:uncharacterized protein (TIGR02391 family)